MRGRIHLQLRDRDGALVAERRATNSVMRGGAELVANLFTGDGVPINRMGVGTSDTPETDAFTTEALTNPPEPDASRLEGATEIALAPEEFTVSVDETHRLVKVRCHATLPESAAVGTLREAGLLARPDGEGDAVLYNRVTFSPISKNDDHELTMFWEVSFPYGDLQWMT
ncbi:MAG TPA: hypothetical protein VGJ77_20090 [Gaiellaceae bacterium]|jgi:hypothetical protein